MTRELTRFHLFLLGLVPAFGLLWSYWLGEPSNPNNYDPWTLADLADGLLTWPSRLAFELAVVASLPLGILEGRALRRGESGREYAAAHAVVVGAFIFLSNFVSPLMGGERQAMRNIAIGALSWLMVCLVQHGVAWICSRKEGAVGRPGEYGLWLLVWSAAAMPVLYALHTAPDGIRNSGLDLTTKFVVWPFLATLPIAVVLGVLAGMGGRHRSAGLVPLSLVVVIAAVASFAWTTFDWGMMSTSGSPGLAIDMFAMSLGNWLAILTVDVVAYVTVLRWPTAFLPASRRAALDGKHVLAVVVPLLVLVVMLTGGFSTGLLAPPTFEGGGSYLSPDVPMGLLLVALPLGLLEATVRVARQPLVDVRALQYAVAAAASYAWLWGLPSSEPPAGAGKIDGAFLAGTATYFALLVGGWLAALVTAHVWLMMRPAPDRTA